MKNKTYRIHAIVYSSINSTIRDSYDYRFGHGDQQWIHASDPACRATCSTESLATVQNIIASLTREQILKNIPSAESRHIVIYAEEYDLNTDSETEILSKVL